MDREQNGNGSIAQHHSIRAHQIDEILEQIWMYEENHQGKNCSLENLAEHKVTEIDINEMVQHGLVNQVDKRIVLQNKGKERVRRIIRAHRLAECLLSEAFSFPEETLEIHACSFEHVLCQPVVDSVCTLLGHPRCCPHGKRIPEGPCCRDGADNIKPIVFPLTNLNIEENAKIVSIFTQKNQRLDFLTSVGIHPGTTFFLERKKPVYVLKIDETRFAIEEEVARDILVRKL
jgi:DtxR family Mn-dependent transcriptional regulator